jgi:alkylation response protein AidB-like acyl-CoA dehydrogenase
VAEPLLGALVVGQALIAAGTDAQKRQLEDIIAGGVIAALAHDEPGSHYELNKVTATAARTATGWVLNGAKSVVAFGEKADLLLVSARTAGACSILPASACSWSTATPPASPSVAIAAWKAAAPPS